jgi:hypothetical protein
VHRVLPHCRIRSLHCLVECGGIRCGCDQSTICPPWSRCMVNSDGFPDPRAFISIVKCSIIPNTVDKFIICNIICSQLRVFSTRFSSNTIRIFVNFADLSRNYVLFPPFSTKFVPEISRTLELFPKPSPKRHRIC